MYLGSLSNFIFPIFFSICDKKISIKIWFLEVKGSVDLQSRYLYFGQMPSRWITFDPSGELQPLDHWTWLLSSAHVLQPFRGYHTFSSDIICYFTLKRLQQDEWDSKAVGITADNVSGMILSAKVSQDVSFDVKVISTAIIHPKLNSKFIWHSYLCVIVPIQRAILQWLWMQRHLGAEHEKLCCSRPVHQYAHDCIIFLKSVVHFDYFPSHTEKMYSIPFHKNQFYISSCMLRSGFVQIIGVMYTEGIFYHAA